MWDDQASAHLDDRAHRPVPRRACVVHLDTPGARGDGPARGEPRAGLSWPGRHAIVGPRVAGPLADGQSVEDGDPLEDGEPFAGPDVTVGQHPGSDTVRDVARTGLLGAGHGTRVKLTHGLWCPRAACRLPVAHP